MAICKVCAEEYSDQRAKLGYKTCLAHPEPPKQYTLAPAYNKGAYQVISRQEVQYIGRK